MTSYVGLTRGSGVIAPASGAAARAWGGTDWIAASSSAAATANDTVTFGFTVGPNKQASISSIDLAYRRSSSGPSSGQWSYQIGSGSFVDIGAVQSFSNSTSTGAALPSLDLTSVTALQNLTPGTQVTFRLANFGGTNTGGTWYVYDFANSTANDLVVNGTVTDATAGTSTTTTLTSITPLTANQGDSVTFQGTVVAATGTATPTGTIEIRNGGATGTLLASTTAITGSGLNGTYNFSSTTIPVGTFNSIQAYYVPSAGFAASNSATFGSTLTVNAVGATTTTTITSITPLTANTGDSITFAGTVVANSGTATPTGTVEIRDGGATGTLLASTTAITGSGVNGAFSFSSTSVPAGTYSSIQAFYIAGSGFQSSNSTTFGSTLTVSGTAASINYTGGTYTQNFDTLAATGTASTLPTGWLFAETGTAANTIYTAGNGSSNSGDTFSFGTGTATDRAFGGLQSGSLIPTVGAAIKNSSGSTLTSFTLGYTGEQWRLGATSRADQLDFQYSLDATSLTTGTWIDVNTLDFVAPITAGTVGALDGNATANRTAVSTTVGSLSIANNATFWVRWVDFNASGADDGLGIDDITFTASNAALVSTTTTLASITPLTVNQGDSITFAGTVVAASGSATPTGSIEIRNGTTVIASTTTIGGSGVNGSYSFSSTSVPVGTYNNLRAYYVASGSFQSSNSEVFASTLTVNAVTSNFVNYTGGNYSQNFDSLATTATATSSTLPTGWSLAETGTGANATYSANDGGSGAGDTYSYGSGATAERALGSLQSGSVVPSFGAAIKNSTGSALNTLFINYSGEQWRLGALGREDRLDFQYSLDATSLTTGTWIDADSLDFIAPVTAGTVGALDGNLAVNRSAVSGTVASLNIADNAIFYVRWLDFGANGADDGLAIDDVTISASNANTASTTTTLDAVSPLTVNQGDAVTFTGTVVAGTGSSTPTGTVEIRNGATLLASTTTISGSTASGTFNLSSTSIPVGTYGNLRAVYVPSGNFTSSTSGVFSGTLTVNPVGASTTTSLTSISPLTANAGDTITFAGTVVAGSGSATPAGTIEIRNGGATGTLLASSTTITGTGANGAFNLSSSTVPAGTYSSIQAFFVPSSGFLASSSATFSSTLTVNAAAAFINYTSGNYVQNFDSLASASTSSTLPSGWFVAEAGSGANSNYTASNGSATAGDTYSFGTTSASERALGTVQSGSVVPTFGASIKNSSGSTLTSFSLAYTGEQWRMGTTAREDRLDFQYSLDATSLTTGTWFDADALDFVAPINSGSTGALDGNLPANRATKSATIGSLSIADGATFWIRWNDFDATGAEDGLAIDDLTFSASNAALVSTSSTLDSITPLTVNQGETVTFAGTVVAGSGTATPTGTVEIRNGTTVLASTTTIAGSGVNGTFNFSSTTIPAGTYNNIRAFYVASGSFQSSNSPVFGSTLTVNAASTNVINFGSGTYSQNFDTLAATGTSATLPTGWLLSETGSGANASYSANDGSGNTGDTFSYGTGTTTDRALGSLQSGSVVPTLERPSRIQLAQL